ncbi:hypothetical protein WGC32_14300 [Zongyangia sp. HA2173]|uniref:hypothetical protein n=1 Tax=Zongyangia sp. HA2173 TaxID=3133035 RepID=UPI00315E9D2E
MAEYIDRETLLDELCRDNCERTYDGTCHNCRMTETIADFPAADVAPVVHGRWEWFDEKNGTPIDGWEREWGWRCSTCKCVLNDEYDDPDKQPKYNHCPNCGTKMDLDTADDEQLIYKSALNKWGKENQTRMMFEEMAELQKELCKEARGEDNTDAIAEEIADVKIMLEQMTILHNCKDMVEMQMKRKLQRLKERLEGE